MKTYLAWILRHRLAVIVATLLLTLLALTQLHHLRIIVDPNTMLPKQHPYVTTTEKVDQLFGTKYTVVIGLTPQQGEIYQTEVLSKVQKITAAVLQAPGVIPENVLSLSAKKAKSMIGTEDGIVVTPLMANLPQTAEEMAALKHTITHNPVYLNSLVSRDHRTTSIIAEFRDVPGGFRSIADNIEAIVGPERAANVRIDVGGMPIYLAELERYSERMAWLLPLAILIVALVLYRAFRSWQGMILPLVTASMAVVWGLGMLGAAGIPMDTFNATTPILILAVAAGHAVQLLKRYYEEYARLHTQLPPQQANQQAIHDSLLKVGPVMLTAGLIATMGFFSLMVFDIRTVRTFGFFTGSSILAALMLELSFIPAMRACLKPPKPHTLPHTQNSRVLQWLANTPRKWIYGSAALLLILALLGLNRVVMDNSTKQYFFNDTPLQQADQNLNRSLGGTNTLFVLIEGDTDAIKQPATLNAIDQIQRFLEQRPEVGKTVSMADFIKRMNQAMHNNDPAYNRVPETAELVSQYLLLYSMSGEPGDFDSYVDYGYRSANIAVYLKTDSSAKVEALIHDLQQFAAPRLGPQLKLNVGGSVPQSAALNDSMVEGKLLNILQIAAVVLLISALVFRSLLAGCLVLLPLIFAVLLNFGIMGWSGILLNIPTAMVSAMAIGIGADYAIYILYRLREELAHGHDLSQAMQNTIHSAGKAALFVASAIALGYGVLMFSWGFYIHLWMGLLIAAAMMVSVLAALTLIPAVILSLKPKFIFRSL